VNNVYGLKPVNKTAAMVTSQSGCATDDTLTNEQLRENLVSQCKSIDAELSKHKKGTQERRRLGLLKADICRKISDIRPAKKSPGLENFIIDILRESMTKVEFDILLRKANKRMVESLGCGAGE